MFDIVTMGIFLGALALLIMSAIIYFSASKLAGLEKVKADTGAFTKATDIKRTGLLLLLVSIVVTGMYGYKLYGQYQAHSAVPSFSYYF
jgi:hypothetical protein